MSDKMKKMVKMETIKIAILGMSCAECEYIIEQATAIVAKGYGVKNMLTASGAILGQKGIAASLLFLMMGGVAFLGQWPNAGYDEATPLNLVL